MISKIKDLIQGKASISDKISSKWPTVRKHHLDSNPACAVCGGLDSIEVHHKMPFHLDKSLELNPDNLITLCESNKNGVNCHLHYGHLGSYKSYNKDVTQDTANIAKKLKERP